MKTNYKSQKGEIRNPLQFLKSIVNGSAVVNCRPSRFALQTPVHYDVVNRRPGIARGGKKYFVSKKTLPVAVRPRNLYCGIRSGGVVG